MPVFRGLWSVATSLLGAAIGALHRIIGCDQNVRAQRLFTISPSLNNDGPNLGVVGGWGFEIGAGSPREGSGSDFIARSI
jgi:hypothetical protein